MKNFYFIHLSKSTMQNTGKLFLILLLISFMSTRAISQRVIQVSNGTELSSVILGDTLDNGDPVDPNTIYELEMNGLFPVAKSINITWTLHLRAGEGEGFLPFVYAQKDESNNYPKVINTHGDVILERIHLSNANGPDANPKWGGFRVGGTNSRVILTGCLFEYDKASSVQIRADSIKLYMTNCVAGKTGNYAAYNGNGRLVDTRGYYVDSIVIKNVTAYYMQDRIIRNMGGEINYFEMDHVTVVNNQGFHGTIAMAKVHHAKITNNLLINAQYGGDRLDDPEQTGPWPDNHHIYMITMDTIFDDSELEIHNNNFAFTLDMIDFFNSIDSVWKPMILAPTVAQVLGADSANAFFEEVVDFQNMPGPPWDFINAMYTDPQPSPMPNNWPDEIGIENLNAAYAHTYQSYTAGEEGKPVGDLKWFPEWNSIKTHNSSLVTGTSVYPNPVSNIATFGYELKKSSDVQLIIFSITGQQVKAINIGYQTKGQHVYHANMENLPGGIYIYGLGNGVQMSYGKVMVNK
jgi:hypothetical protein